MEARSAAPVPVLISFPAEAARQDAWGRISELTVSGARLSTQAGLEAGKGLRLSFEIAGEAFAALEAEVAWVERDADGYSQAQARFGDQAEKRRLAKALIEWLASSPP